MLSFVYPTLSGIVYIVYTLGAFITISLAIKKSIRPLEIMIKLIPKQGIVKGVLPLSFNCRPMIKILANGSHSAVSISLVIS